MARQQLQEEEVRSVAYQKVWQRRTLTTLTDKVRGDDHGRTCIVAVADASVNAGIR